MSNLEIDQLSETAHAEAVRFLHDFLTVAPAEMRANQKDYWLAMPPIFQRMILRYYARNNPSYFDAVGHDISRHTAAVLETFAGYRVIPHYKMEIVLFHSEAVVHPERGIHSARIV